MTRESTSETIGPDRIKADLLGGYLSCGSGGVYFPSLDKFKSFEIQSEEDAEYVKEIKILSEIESRSGRSSSTVNFLVIYKNVDGDWRMSSKEAISCT